MPGLFEMADLVHKFYTHNLSRDEFMKLYAAGFFDKDDEKKQDPSGYDYFDYGYDPDEDYLFEDDTGDISFDNYSTNLSDNYSDDVFFDNFTDNISNNDTVGFENDRYDHVNNEDERFSDNDLQQEHHKKRISLSKFFSIFGIIIYIICLILSIYFVVFF